MAPIVFMMIFGMIWGGIMFMQYIHYSNAIRTAAREVAVTNTEAAKETKEAWLRTLWKEEISIPLYEPNPEIIRDTDEGVVIITVAFKVPDETYATLPNILKNLQFPPQTIRTMQYRMKLETADT